MVSKKRFFKNMTLSGAIFLCLPAPCMASVATDVLSVIAAVAAPAITSAQAKAQQINVLNQGRQIHLVAITMAIDGMATNDKNLGWPGDLKANGKISTLADYVNLLVEYHYLRPADLKIFANPKHGFPAYEGKLAKDALDPPFTEKNSAFKVFLVKESDPSDTVFLLSKGAADGDKDIVILRKGGDGQIIKKEAVQEALKNLKYPGGATAESAENCLNPDPPRR